MQLDGSNCIHHWWYAQAAVVECWACASQIIYLAGGHVVAGFWCRRGSSWARRCRAGSRRTSPAAAGCSGWPAAPGCPPPRCGPLPGCRLQTNESKTASMFARKWTALLDTPSSKRIPDVMCRGKETVSCSMPRCSSSGAEAAALACKGGSKGAGRCDVQPVGASGRAGQCSGEQRHAAATEAGTPPRPLVLS